MYKCIDVGGWDFGVKTAEIIPVSSRGLTQSDSNSFFTKRAGEHRFKHILDGIKLAKDEIPIHLIAMGSTENYGCNRNGDGWTEEMLKRDHPSFVKSAKVFYHHENKDPKKAFGKVAASIWNDEMSRVELLVLLNGSKEAADKNGGKIAPKEDIDALYSGKELPWSMGSSVPIDVCSSCGNKAKTAAQYCEEHECIDKNGKQRFGCKSGLCKTAEDGFVQYVDNPSGRFIDISRVSTPADRTAYGAIAKYATAAGTVLGGAQLALARGLYDNPDEFIIKVAELKKYSWALLKLASIESSLAPARSGNNLDLLIKVNGFIANDSLSPALEKFARLSDDKTKCAHLMHLADFNMVLSPKQFAKYAGYKVSVAYGRALENMFGLLNQAVDSRDQLLHECNKYACSRQRSMPAHYHLFTYGNLYNKVAEQKRAVDGLVADVKRAKIAGVAITEEDYKAAVEYCLYKVAAMTRLKEDEHYVTAVIQNMAAGFV